MRKGLVKKTYLVHSTIEIVGPVFSNAHGSDTSAWIHRCSGIVLLTVYI